LATYGSTAGFGSSPDIAVIAPATIRISLHVPRLSISLSRAPTDSSSPTMAADSQEPTDSPGPTVTKSAEPTDSPGPTVTGSNEPRESPHPSNAPYASPSLHPNADPSVSFKPSDLKSFDIAKLAAICAGPTNEHNFHQLRPRCFHSIVIKSLDALAQRQDRRPYRARHAHIKVLDTRTASHY
jgi:hypothetical protein